MAFVVEDGTGVINANAYILVAFADTYHTERLNTAWTELTDETFKEGAIIKATDYIDYRWDFIGKRKKALELQTLKWPRISAFVKRENKTLVPNQVPYDVERACAEYAILAVTLAAAADTLGELAPPPDIDDTGGKLIGKREKVGPVEEELKFSGSFGLFTLRPYPAADNYLRNVAFHGRPVVRS